MKIIALSNPRSGTNYILECLAQKHSTLYLGEFLHENLQPESVVYNESSKIITNYSNIKKETDLADSYINSQRFSSILLNTSSPWTAKVFTKHLKHSTFNSIFKLFTKPDFYKVLIYRSDILDTALSYIIARKYNKWQAYCKEELVYLNEVSIDCKIEEEFFMTFFHKTINQFNYLKELSKLFKWDTIYDYSKLTGNPRIDFNANVYAPCIKLLTKEEKLSKFKNFSYIENKIRPLLENDYSINT
tara:strand:- start:22 stop:756 length:735 start_codon:yes stop_codon:yes gene_type:complete